jgi:hyperosmotically inducible protein
MISALFRLLIVVVLVVAALAFFLGYRWSDEATVARETREEPAVGTTGEREPIDTDAARERGARVGETVAGAINEASDRAAAATAGAREVLSDAGMTSKIKSKMALDDLVRARSIDVDTVDGVVTLRGTVSSEQERQRAVRLATETAGVKSVNDQLRVAR